MNTSRIKVHLRERETQKGISLYLDFYPGVRDSLTNKIKRRESLGIYLYKKPKTEREKEYNKEARAQAEAIRDRYSLALRCEEFGFFDNAKLKADFLDYFWSIARRKGDKYESVYYHFDKFMGSRCTFGDLNEDVCNKFRDYLLSAYYLDNDKVKLNQNTAAAYFRTFCGILKQAYKEKWLKENIADFVDKIKEKPTKIEYLTLDELIVLSETHCEHQVLKRAALFSALTGLRKGDILSLKWNHIQPAPIKEYGYTIRKNINKGNREETLPLNGEALELCGERGAGEELVFAGLDKSWTDKPFKNWIKAAGIEKRITFHCLRHTNATLLSALGADLYVIKGLLTHKRIQTTEGYAKLTDKKLWEASRLISLKQANK